MIPRVNEKDIYLHEGFNLIIDAKRSYVPEGKEELMRNLYDWNVYSDDYNHCRRYMSLGLTNLSSYRETMDTICQYRQLMITRFKSSTDSVLFFTTVDYEGTETYRLSSLKVCFEEMMDKYKDLHLFMLCASDEKDWLYSVTKNIIHGKDIVNDNNLRWITRIKLLKEGKK